MKLGYYPGCALKAHATALEFGISTEAALSVLGVELREVPDWNCCGASAGHMTNTALTRALNVRNLALAEAAGMADVLTPCPLCAKELALANKEVIEDPELLRAAEDACEMAYKGTSRPITLIEFLFRNRDLIKAKIDGQLRVRPPCAGECGGSDLSSSSSSSSSISDSYRHRDQEIEDDDDDEDDSLSGERSPATGGHARQLPGVRVACYYGCLHTRPPELMGFDDAEQPTTMDEVCRTLGLEPVEWSHKTECCGAGFTMSKASIVNRLTGRILSAAKAAGAEAIIVSCPMCHANLDMRQGDAAKDAGEEIELPILYLSQALGLALGLEPEELSLGTHFVDTTDIVARLRAEPVAAAAEGERAMASAAPDGAGPGTARDP